MSGTPPPRIPPPITNTRIAFPRSYLPVQALFGPGRQLEPVGRWAVLPNSDRLRLRWADAQLDSIQLSKQRWLPGAVDPGLVPALVPAADDRTAPAAVDPAVPVAVDPAVPMAVDPAVPMAVDPAVPMAVDPAVPAAVILAAVGEESSETVLKSEPSEPSMNVLDPLPVASKESVDFDEASPVASKKSMDLGEASPVASEELVDLGEASPVASKESEDLGDASHVASEESANLGEESSGSYWLCFSCSFLLLISASLSTLCSSLALQ